MKVGIQITSRHSLRGWEVPMRVGQRIKRAALSSIAAMAAIGLVFAAKNRGSAEEPIDTPPSIQSLDANSLGIDSLDSYDASLIGTLSSSPVWDASPKSQLRIFPAVLETRRFGPVEECEPEFYALRNSAEPGFDMTPPGFGWGGGWNGGGGWWPFGYSWGYNWPRFGWSLGAPFPRYGFGLVGYNRYYYRPWYASPSPQVWSTRFPWYSPGGVGPNIYQPWYQSRNALPWYSPYGIGPNIYTPSYSWQSYYPWYSPNGPGPNIYTPPAQYDGCFYW
jgi:hypothetical protein